MPIVVLLDSYLWNDIEAGIAARSLQSMLLVAVRLRNANSKGQQMFRAIFAAHLSVTDIGREISKIGIG